jgi:hypothetical protein
LGDLIQENPLAYNGQRIFCLKLMGHGVGISGADVEVAHAAAVADHIEVLGTGEEGHGLLLMGLHSAISRLLGLLGDG